MQKYSITMKKEHFAFYRETFKCKCPTVDIQSRFTLEKRQSVKQGLNFDTLENALICSFVIVWELLTNTKNNPSAYTKLTKQRFHTQKSNVKYQFNWLNEKPC